MAACHSQSPDHSLLLGCLPQATTSWSMPHGRMPLAITSQSLPHGRMPLAITSQSMPHGRLPFPVSKNRDGHGIMPLGCLPLSYFPYVLPVPLVWMVGKHLGLLDWKTKETKHKLVIDPEG